ncbi:hypothetical protein CEXT_305371 [Caerostris extrusa]|uniref:Uncharacterized protein n=1 Tax=Caerostris extrusa TaxID=172846 RepID=A0AAV4MZC9_CAEEX|nr:hypothetical protein CEXT_305371 [Caerostris extrusa]
MEGATHPLLLVPCQVCAEILSNAKKRIQKKVSQNYRNSTKEIAPSSRINGRSNTSIILLEPCQVLCGNTVKCQETNPEKKFHRIAETQQRKSFQAQELMEGATHPSLLEPCQVCAGNTVKCQETNPEKKFHRIPETQQRKSFQAQELMEGATSITAWNLVKCVRKYCQMPRNESRKKVSQEYRWREYVHNLKMDNRFQ